MENGQVATENDNNMMVEDPDSNPGPIIINQYSMKPPDDDDPPESKLTSTTSTSPDTEGEIEEKDKIVENGSTQPDKDAAADVSKDDETIDKNTKSASPSAVKVDEKTTSTPAGKEDKTGTTTPAGKEDKTSTPTPAVKEEKKTTTTAKVDKKATPVSVKKEWSLLTCEVCKASFLSSQGLKSHQANSGHYPGEKSEANNKNDFDYKKVPIITTTTPSSSSKTDNFKFATKRKLDVKNEPPSTPTISAVKSIVKVDTKPIEPGDKANDATTTPMEPKGDPRNMSLDEAMQLAQVNAFGFFSCLVCRSSFLSSQGLRSHYQNSCLASSLTRKNLEKLEPPPPPPVAQLPESPVAKKSKKEPTTPKVRAKKAPVAKPPVKRGRGRPRKIQQPESTDEEEEYESESEEEVEEEPPQEDEEESESEEEQDDDNNYYYEEEEDAEEPQQDDNDYEEDYDDDDDQEQYEPQDPDYWAQPGGSNATYMLSSPDDSQQQQQQVGRHPCKICDDSYNNKLHLNAHYRSHKKPYVCRICAVTYTKIGQFKAHECQISVPAAAEYQEVSTPQKCFTCPILNCGKAFVSKTTLKVHLKSHAKKYHGCPDCPKKYLSKHDLSTHIQAVHVRKAINCPKCDKSFASMGHLFAHMKEHAEYQKQFKCHLCPCSFDSRPSLARHYQNHPVAMRVGGVAAASPKETTTSKQNASKGSKSGNVKNSTPGRMKKQESSNDEDDDDSRLTCNVCQKQFVSERTLSRHQQTAHGKRGAAAAFECSECEMSFNREQELRSHIIFIHTLNHGKRR